MPCKFIIIGLQIAVRTHVANHGKYPEKPGTHSSAFVCNFLYKF